MGESSWNGYEQNCLFQNRGSGSFVDVARPAGGAARRDLVVANNDAPPVVYLNRSAAGGWLEVELTGRESPRDPVGTRLRLTVAGPRGERVLTRWVEAGSGYASQSSFTVHFGLGAEGRPRALEILWPSGRRETLAADALGRNRRLHFVEGASPPAPAPAGGRHG